MTRLPKDRALSVGDEPTNPACYQLPISSSRTRSTTKVITDSPISKDRPGRPLRVLDLLFPLLTSTGSRSEQIY